MEDGRGRRVAEWQRVEGGAECWCWPWDPVGRCSIHPGMGARCHNRGFEEKKAVELIYSQFEKGFYVHGTRQRQAL